LERGRRFVDFQALQVFDVLLDWCARVKAMVFKGFRAPAWMAY
jgi:hypothetical protein